MANNPLSALRLALLKMSSAFGGGARRPPDISAALANPQWPAEWPFSAADFRRQDEVRAARLPLWFVCLAGCSFFFVGPRMGRSTALGCGRAERSQERGGGVSTMEEAPWGTLLESSEQGWGRFG